MEFLKYLATKYCIDLENEYHIFETTKKNELKEECDSTGNVFQILIDIINEKYMSEQKHWVKTWYKSPFNNITNLTKNNVGVVGENFIHTICNKVNIHADLNGIKTKQVGGGCGDGYIFNDDIQVEVKCAYLNNDGKTFQHELGKHPWNPTFLCFIDICPDCIYVTLLKNNFTEEDYNRSVKFDTFPSRSVHRRHNQGAYKFDTTVSLNENAIKHNMCFKFTNDTNIMLFSEYLKNIIV